jgi:hypothetical protein
VALPQLSELHFRFVEEYVHDKNGTRAALAVGLGGTYQSARQTASALLTNPDIKRWVKHLLNQQSKALKFKPSKVLQNWMLAATANLTYFEVNAAGKLDTVPGVPKRYLRAVRKWKYLRTEALNDANELVIETKAEIELRDPFGPEQKLMEHYGELVAEGHGDATAALDALARLDALLASRQPRPEPSEGDAGGGAAVPPVGG